jgi:hypothetical protein
MACFFFFFLIHVGCPGQLACTTTIPHGPLDILQAQEQVRHRGGDRRAQRGSNPGERAEQVHEWPQQLDPQVHGLFFSFTSLGSPFPHNFLWQQGPVKAFFDFMHSCFHVHSFCKYILHFDKTRYFHPIFLPTCQTNPSIINFVNWVNVFSISVNWVKFSEIKDLSLSIENSSSQP